VLIDDPKDKTFKPFGDARWKIQGEAIMGRQMYFAIYQAIARDERRPGLYRNTRRTSSISSSSTSATAAAPLSLLRRSDLHLQPAPRHR
jgi:hypothetical protein